MRDSREFPAIEREKVIVARVTVTKTPGQAFVRFYNREDQPCGSVNIEKAAKSRSIRSLVDEAFTMFNRPNDWQPERVPAWDMAYAWERKSA